MKCHHFLSAAILTILTMRTGVGQEAPGPSIPPLMSVPGKLLYSDDFSKPFGKQWRVGKGKWEVVDGVMRGAELTSDMHGAVARHEMPFDNVIIQFSVKFDGAKSTSLSINKSNGHLSRVRITPSDLTVQKDDQDGKKGSDKALVLDSRKVKLAPGEWHTVLVELQGTEIVASLDGKTVAFGTHGSIEGPKANFGLTVAGEAVSFKNLRVWDASASKNWPATREKLRTN